MDDSTKEAAKTLSLSGVVTAIISAVFAGSGPGSVADAIHTALVTFIIEHQKPVMISLILVVFLIWNANALRKVYPDGATRPRWVQWLMYLMPTTPPPKAT